MADRYWIALSTGRWNNTANWSATSGGTGGESVPGIGDTAYFNQKASICLVTEPVTVKKILTTGFGGDLVTLASLNCERLEWAGFRLLLAKSQIDDFIVLRTRANGSQVSFDPWFGARHAKVNAINLTYTQKSGTSMTFQWNAVPNATSYQIQYSINNGTSWSYPSSGSYSGASYTGVFNTSGNVLIRVRAVLPGSIFGEYSIIPISGDTADFSIDFNLVWAGISIVPGVTQPLDLGTLEVVTGSNAITITNNTETRLTGAVTIPAGITVSQEQGSKLTLFGTQDQVVSVFSGNPEFSLNKPAGKVSLTGTLKLLSDLLRNSSEIDPRTATLLDLKSVWSSAIELTGDVACRSYDAINNGMVTIPTGVTLDTYSFTGDLDTSVCGSGTLRVCQGKYVNTGNLQSTITIDYWNEQTGPTLGAPTSISASAFSSTRIDVTVGINTTFYYDNPYNTNYVIERSLNGIDGWQVVSTENWYVLCMDYGLSAYTYNDTNLTPSTTYYYRARAVDGSDTSNYTSVVNATTQSGSTPPATPNQIFVSDQRTTEIDLWWNVVNSATSYVLERTTNYGNPNAWVQVYNGSATVCTDSGLTSGTLYYYRLKAVNMSGDSNWSPMVAAATATYPAPANLTIIKVATESITLQWSSKYDPIDHLAAWSPNGIDSWTEIQTLSQSSFVFSGLTPETTYYFRVRARYASVNSPWSQIVSATTFPLPEPVNTLETWSVTKRISQKFEVKTGFSGDKQ